MALRSENFVDILDPRFRRIADQVYNEQPDQVDKIYYMDPGSGQQSERFSMEGTVGTLTQFTGTVSYDDIAEGYRLVLTPLEFASGLQIERRLFDDAQFGIIDRKPRALSSGVFRTRQQHAARLFNNAASVDSFFYTHSEGVSLASSSHTTRASGVSTSTGFDNTSTSALTATALTAARISMVQFKDDRGLPISIVPDTLIYPVDLYAAAYEIIESAGKPDTAENNANVHKGGYSSLVDGGWVYLSSTSNWGLMDSSMMKNGFGPIWIDRTKMEFAFVEDIDTLVGKWRVYCRWGNGYLDWRWLLWSSVS